MLAPLPCRGDGGKASRWGKTTGPRALKSKRLAGSARPCPGVRGRPWSLRGRAGTALKRPCVCVRRVSETGNGGKVDSGIQGPVFYHLKSC